MEKVELLNNIQKMVVDIHIKMYDLRNRIAYETDADVKQRAEKLLMDLDEMQSNLHEQFNNLDSSNHDRRVTHEIEEKIYNNIRYLRVPLKQLVIFSGRGPDNKF
jgi:hypothetical protein